MLGCRKPAQSNTGSSQTLHHAITYLTVSYKGPKHSTYLDSMGIFFCSVQFENQKRWQNKYRMGVCVHFLCKRYFSIYVRKPMDKKQTWYLTQKDKKGEGSLTNRHAAPAVNTYNDRSIFFWLP